MTSIYQQVLGDAFARLHPRLQERFGFDSSAKKASIGHGVMHRVRRGSWLVLPFLWLGSLVHLLFPEVGRRVPFTVANHAFRDERGREVVTWIRTFHFPGRTRRFDAYMVADRAGGVIIDYFGTHAHYSTELRLQATDQGAMAIESGRHWFHVLGLAIPWPEWLAARAHVVESYDDRAACYRISVHLRNPIIGDIFGYEGEFAADWVTSAAPPPDMIPRCPLPGRGRQPRCDTDGESRVARGRG